MEMAESWLCAAFKKRGKRLEYQSLRVAARGPREAVVTTDENNCPLPHFSLKADEGTEAVV